MAVRRSRAVREIRLTLVGTELADVKPPQGGWTRCVVQNGTAADVQIHTTDDGSEYRALAAGFERAIVAGNFRHDETAFWLLSTPGGLVILEWS